jgi:hypothetical protein
LASGWTPSHGFRYEFRRRHELVPKKRQTLNTFGMQTKLERDVHFLKIYAAVATLLCAVFVLAAFAQARNQKFDEIDVERINIVEKDGKLRMVISNRERQHPGISNGKVIPRPNGRPPGMIFFNHKGDESENGFSG